MKYCFKNVKTQSVLDTLIEFSNLDNGKCKDELKATFLDGEREYFVTFCNERLMFECYGWDGLLLCTFVYEHFPEHWTFDRWRFAFGSFADLTNQLLSGARAQDLTDAFKSKTQTLEDRLNKFTNIIGKHEK